MSLKIDGYNYYNNLTPDQQKLIKNVMLTTIDMCNEMAGEDIIFFEDAAIRSFMYEMLGRMINNEYYSVKNS